MAMNAKKNNEGTEIDIAKIFFACLRKWWIFLIVMFLCGSIAYAATKIFVRPTYQSSIKFQANTTTKVNLENGDVTTISKPSANDQNLVPTYEECLKSENFISIIEERTNVEISKKNISTKAVSNTSIFMVTVTAKTPEDSEKIAEAIGEAFPVAIEETFDGFVSARIIEGAQSAVKNDMGYTRNMIIGVIIGFIVVAAVIFVIELMDNTVHSESDITDMTEAPILAHIPDQEGSVLRDEKTGETRVVCDKMRFLCAEAFKMLRTKLSMSIPDTTDENGLIVKRGRVFGVTSSVKGEGKSTTSINLAYTLAEAGSKVCLIEGDLRLPSVKKSLGISGEKGISNVLVGQCKSEEVVQSYTTEKGVSFDVLTAGESSPAPSELLASDKMAKLMEYLKEIYDYVVIDLPPVTVVADPLIVSKVTDGMLLVVRHNYSDKRFLSEALHHFEFAGTRILGVVLTVDNGMIGESKYGHYVRKYYDRKYYSGKYYNNKYNKSLNNNTDSK